MGSPADEVGRSYVEGPQREVTISRGFWLGETPCTQDLWEAMGREHRHGYLTPQRPAVAMTWYEAVEFLQELSRRLPGATCRLPTEAEWEYACRAGTTAATYASALVEPGEDPPSLWEIAWYDDNSGIDFDLHRLIRGPRITKEKLPNPWGLYDMLGNVDEWCSDWRDRTYDPDQTTDPSGPATGRQRVVRGGAWNQKGRWLRAAARGAHYPSQARDDLGFRIVVEAG